jgi:hypothetical protein
MMTDGRGVVPDPRNNIQRIGEEKLKKKRIKDRLKKN